MLAFSAQMFCKHSYYQPQNNFVMTMYVVYVFWNIHVDAMILSESSLNRARNACNGSFR